MDIGFGGGNAFEVFQSLLQCAQIQHVTGRQRKFVLKSSDTTRVGRIGIIHIDAYLPYPSGNHRQRQGAAVDVLRCGQNAGGGVAAGNHGVLRQGHDVVDALCSQTHTGFKPGLGNGLV